MPSGDAISDRFCGGWTDEQGYDLSLNLRTGWAVESVGTPLVDGRQPSPAYVVIASFHPGDAVKLMTEITNYARRCSSFEVRMGTSATSPPITIKVTSPSVPGLGDQAIDVRCTATKPANALFGVQCIELVAVRIGDMILFVSDDNRHADIPPLLDLARPLAEGMYLAR